MIPSRSPAAYTAHNSWSDPKAFADALRAIPASAADIANAVQGLLIHDYFGAVLYDSAPADIHSASRQTLPIASRLATVPGFPEASFTEPRRPDARCVGTCRDFALLCCAIWRCHGVPARVRCGFAQYFHPPTFEDHWICQYWSAEDARWVSMDAQMDSAHREHLGIAFDPYDLPAGQFLFPWQVWTHHPDRLEDFGHGDAKGGWFIRVNLARDLLSLTGCEVSGWDAWRSILPPYQHLTAAQIAQSGRLAQAGQRMDETFDDVSEAVAKELSTPPVWNS